MLAVVVTFDSLATSGLACYGNEWIETPNFDRLAARGVVFDGHFADHTGSMAGMGWATGRYSGDGTDGRNDYESPWSELMAGCGVELHLVNEPDALPWSFSLRRTTHEHLCAERSPNSKPDQIPFALAVKSVQKQLTQPRETISNEVRSRIFWLQSAGVPEPWEPPEGFATLYFEDFADRGFDMEELPCEAWKFHPAVYAGYVSLLDYWLGELLQSVEAAAQHEPTLLIVTAARGTDWQTRFRCEPIDPFAKQFPYIPSWERGIPGRAEIDRERRKLCRPLSDAIARTPLLLRMWDRSTDGGLASESFERNFAGTRSRQLVRTSDLPTTLLEYFNVLPLAKFGLQGGFVSSLRDNESAREAVCFTDGAGSRGIRTENWSLFVTDQPERKTQSDATSDISGEGIHGASGEESVVELFVKPDDLWESLDVVGQHRELAAELLVQLNETLPVGSNYHKRDAGFDLSSDQSKCRSGF